MCVYIHVGTYERDTNDSDTLIILVYATQVFTNVTIPEPTALR